MRRWIPILAVVLGLQLLAAISLGVRKDALAPLQPDALLVAADLNGADKLALDGPLAAEPSGDKSNGERVELVKQNGRWLIPAYHDAPASAEKVNTLLQQLSALKRGLPVATTDAALKRFKVADDEYERRLVASADGKPLATVYLGSSPGPRKSHARTGQDSAVYAVELSAFDLPTGKTDWLDQSLLKLEANTLSEIEIVAANKDALTLQRSTAPASQAGSAPGWQVQDLPAGKRLNDKQAATLVDTIAGLKVDAVLGVENKPEWRQDQPQLRLTLKDTRGKVVTWALSKPAAGEIHVLKASDHAWYFELKTWNAQPLIDAAAIDKLVQ